jgi:FKBP-type peptidyl-prolyl cis-trans isomerase FkpA
VNLVLNQAINGWQIGVPLLKEGGTMKLIVPSSLAWGCTGAGSGTIPRDAVVYFDVTLVDVL